MILDRDFHLFNVGEHSSYLCGKYAGEILSLVLQDDIQQTARQVARFELGSQFVNRLVRIGTT